MVYRFDCFPDFAFALSGADLGARALDQDAGGGQQFQASGNGVKRIPHPRGGKYFLKCVKKRGSAWEDFLKGWGMVRAANVIGCLRRPDMGGPR